MKSAASITGVAPARLRTWERRYGVPSPDRAVTGRRLYDERDLGVIRRMAELVEAGVPAAEAAAAALATPWAASLAEVRPEVEAAGPAATELVDAARRFDGPTMTGAIRRAVAERGWGRALEDLVFPALRVIGEGWESGAIEVAVEHYASSVIRREIGAGIAAKPAAGGRPVVLACPPGEQHDIGLVALHLLLADAGVPVLYLGADVPAGDLAEAVRQSDAVAVCLSIASAGGAASCRRAIRAVGRIPASRIFVGGPGLAHVPQALNATELPAPIGEAAAAVARAVS